MCSPTRASLLTGRNHHRVGAGIIAEFANDFDGYIGEIPRLSATMARILRDYGYVHGRLRQMAQHAHHCPDALAGPFDQYPTGLGFNYFYGFIAGETSQYEPRLWRNTTPVEPAYADDYHLTEDLARDAIGYIRTNRALNPDKPLFLYFAPGAVHGPHHVPAEWADKYSGHFDDGWEALREKTFSEQKALGSDSAGGRADADHARHAALGGCARSAARLPNPSDGGLRRFPGAHRHPVRQDRRRASGSPGHPRQHAHLLHRLRQRRFG